jgi:glycolate oxidase FAD binding subunit
VLLEGEPGDVLKRSTRISDVLGGDASTHPDLPTWCGRHPFGPNEVGLQITVPSAHLPNAIYALHDVAAAPVPIRGSASTGIIHASLPSSTRPDWIAVMVDLLRTVLIARDGSCVIVSAPPTTPDAVNL